MSLIFPRKLKSRCIHFPRVPAISRSKDEPGFLGCKLVTHGRASIEILQVFCLTGKKVSICMNGLGPQRLFTRSKILRWHFAFSIYRTRFRVAKNLHFLSELGDTFSRTVLLSSAILLVSHSSARRCSNTSRWENSSFYVERDVKE